MDPVLSKTITCSPLNHLGVARSGSVGEGKKSRPGLTALLAFSSSLAISGALHLPFRSGTDGTLNTSSCVLFVCESTLGLLVFRIASAEGMRVMTSRAFRSTASSFRRLSRVEGDSSTRHLLVDVSVGGKRGTGSSGRGARDCCEGGTASMRAARSCSMGRVSRDMSEACEE